jgi:hypothetical protein
MGLYNTIAQPIIRYARSLSARLTRALDNTAS